ncbi:MAG: helix-turn-helix transcriptional regulator, partial [Bacillota bacterium]|nr:helix-turn-helix transcriptional regulator [Bacillota bacterium]
MDQNKIGERIRELRNEQRISQDELAKILSITRLTLGKYERGTRTPDASAINVLSHTFNVSADYILGLSDARNPEYREIMSEYGLNEKSAEI